LRAHNLNLSLHAVIARNVSGKDRTDVIKAIGPTGVRARELEELFAAIGWRSLVDLGPKSRAKRLSLLKWSCETLVALPRAHPKERLRQLALKLPLVLADQRSVAKAVHS
jgi:hypothetical protein